LYFFGGGGGGWWKERERRWGEGGFRDRDRWRVLFLLYLCCVVLSWWVWGGGGRTHIHMERNVSVVVHHFRV
jgi:hypothetical protein